MYGGNPITDIEYVNDSDIQFVKNCKYTVNCLIIIIIILIYIIYIICNQQKKLK